MHVGVLVLQVSRMDAQMCVPISVIAQFAKIRALTTDEAAIAACVKSSTVCTVTPQGIRPNIKAERNTIILREIASDTPPAMVSTTTTLTLSEIMCFVEDASAHVSSS
jgi:hypothetical protein